MNDSLERIVFGMSVLLIGGGLYGVVRARQTAARNRAQIDSGEETYFEERRAWEHYGRPSTDPKTIRRGGWAMVVTGLALLLTASPFSIFHWS